jgi:hypothetical protein
MTAEEERQVPITWGEVTIFDSDHYEPVGIGREIN